MTYGRWPNPSRWLRLLPILLLSIMSIGCEGREDGTPPVRITTAKLRAGDHALWAGPGYDDSGWETHRVEEADSQGRIIWIRSNISLAPREIEGRPLAVHVAALAAYEVFWNGQLIGRSGTPGASAAEERQGRVDLHAPIPSELIRPGDNLLAMRLSSFHLPARVKHSLLHVSVGDYQKGSTQAFRTYAAAIIAAGVLLLGGAFFGFAYRADRSDRASLLLALLSVTLLTQFAIEVSRAFHGYPYGVHIWRVGAIFILASLFGVLLVASVQQQFRQKRGRWIIWITLLWCPAAFLLFEGFDDRTYAVILGSAAAAGAAVLPAALKGKPTALLILAGAAAMTLPLAGAFPAFLDQDFYIIASALIAGLCLHRGLVKPPRPVGPPEARERSHADVRLPLLSARGIELCDPRSFLMIKGADDYAEIFLADGSTRLHRGRLSDLEARLPPSFLRVHRSYIVNMACALQLSSAAGSLSIGLKGGATAPVSRTYSRTVRARFAGSGSARSRELDGLRPIGD